jgi:hypothetical protein
MITQTLDRGIQILDDNRGSGRLDPLLYGAVADPTKNIALLKATTLSPKQIYDAGFRDGMRNRGMLGSLCDDPQYQNGFTAGYSSRPSAA